MPVYVRGYGLTKVSEHWKKNPNDLIVEACLKAIDHAGIDTKKVDKIYVANALGEVINKKGHLGALIADELGLIGRPAIRIESASASGGIAIHQATIDIKAGARNILVCGVEKMTDVLPRAIYTARALMNDWETLTAIGASFEALEGLLLRMYLERYGATHENIMKAAVISHQNALNARHAQYRRPLSIDAIKKSPYVADPLHMFEITAPADGAAAVVLSSESGDVEIASSIVVTDRFRIFEREDPLWLESVYKAAQQAYMSMNITHRDLDFIELHDVSTIMATLEIEALGITEKGAGHSFFARDNGLLNSERPVNTFGGLKARGDPIGATGVYQVVEATMQLMNEAGNNQIENAKLGLTLSMGGLGELSVIHILKKR